MKFPSVTGSNLSDQRYNLPQDFEGTYNITLIAYQRFQQRNVDSWGPLLERLAQKYPSLHYYELPTLPNSGWIQQRLIDGTMRRGITDKVVRARTITLYLDVKKFNAELNLPTIDDIYVLLVDKQGEVLWRASGDYTPEQDSILSQRLAELFSESNEIGPI